MWLILCCSHAGKCVDVDECALQLDNCQPHELCVNVVVNDTDPISGPVVGFMCVPQCRRGRVADLNALRRGETSPEAVCGDRDECAALAHRCEPTQRCMNREPGYECIEQCADGFMPVAAPAINLTNLLKEKKGSLYFIQS